MYEIIQADNLKYYVEDFASLLMDVNVLKKTIEKFLREDIGSGDLTSEAILPEDLTGTAEFVSKGSFVVCGIETVAVPVFLPQALHPNHQRHKIFVEFKPPDARLNHTDWNFDHQPSKDD